MEEGNGRAGGRVRDGRTKGDPGVRIAGLTVGRFLRRLFAAANDDDVFTGAAALAFYLTFSLFPALVALMSVLPYLPVEDVDEAILDVLGQALPDEAAVLVEGIVADVTSQERGGLLSIGLVAALWVASSGMYAIMQQLNITYGVREARSFLQARATAIVLSVLFGLLLMGSFTLVVLGGVIEEWLGGRLGYSDALVTGFAVLRWVLVIAATVAGIAFVYRFAPNVRKPLRFIWPGSVFATALLIAASWGFSLYIANVTDYSATYGSIGAVIVLMFWLYMAGLVVLVGSEINAILEAQSRAGDVPVRPSG
jgi:membrane protein